MLLVAVPGGPDMPAPGDQGKIGLTAGDQTSEFACTVELVETRARALSRLTATNGGRLLAQTRVERSYADQTPGAVIADLAQGAGVTSAAGGRGRHPAALRRRRRAQRCSTTSPGSPRRRGGSPASTTRASSP